MPHGLLKKRIPQVVCVALMFYIYFLPAHALALESQAGSAIISTPQHIGGFSGYENVRDADLYPKVAYDAVTQRYLVVWLSPHNAQSTSERFDIYGVFLDRLGQPGDVVFRISDDNTVARSAIPAVAAGNGEFVVAWTARDTACQVVVQKVTDAVNTADRTLLNGAGHRHSPSLVYNSVHQRYALAYVEGDDYLPPTLFGADIADCGNNAGSTSSVNAVEFTFTGDVPVSSSPVALSGATGSFRPALAYSAGMDQYLAAWEDRRNSAGKPYRFDVFAQRVSGEFAPMDPNFALVTGEDYTNYDTTATWTPRPAIAGGDDQFLATWFERAAHNEAVIWSVMGSLVQQSGTPATSDAFPVARITFAQDHTGSSPGGYLSAGFSWASGEFLVGFSSYMESIWGYRSFILVQRVDLDGQLLKLDGTVLSQPGVGSIADYQNEDQLAPGMAVNPVRVPGVSDFLLVYSKHLANQNAEDIDIWSVRVQEEASAARTILLPVILR